MDLVVTFFIVLIVVVFAGYYTVSVYLKSKNMSHSERSQFLLRSTRPWTNLFENLLGRKVKNKERKVLSEKEEPEKPAR